GRERRSGMALRCQSRAKFVSLPGHHDTAKSPARRPCTLARPRTTTPTKPNDARAQRSIDALRSAFLTLIEHKPRDQISIKEIAEVADLGYQTFFRRFS